MAKHKGKQAAPRGTGSRPLGSVIFEKICAPMCRSACLAAARGCPRIWFYFMFGFSFGRSPASSGVPALAARPFGGVIFENICAPICRSACLAAARGCPRIRFYLIFGLTFGRPPASSGVPALAARPFGSVIFEKICAPICRSACLAAARCGPCIRFCFVFGVSFGRPPTSSYCSTAEQKLSKS
jgi:hypothetical protein